MSLEDTTKRIAVNQSCLDEASREICPNFTNEVTTNGFITSPGSKPHPFFVPSTVKSTLGSPVSRLPASGEYKIQLTPG